VRDGWLSDRIGSKMIREELTSSPVDVVKVCVAVLVRTATGFAVEPRDSRSASAGILHDHGLTEVLLQLERPLALFHQLGGLWEVVLLSPSWFLSWVLRTLKKWDVYGSHTLPHAFLVLLHSLLLLQISFLRPFCVLLFVPFLSEVRVASLVCSGGGHGGGGSRGKIQIILSCRDLQKRKSIPELISPNSCRRWTKWTNVGPKKFNPPPPFLSLSASSSSFPLESLPGPRICTVSTYTR